MKKLNLLLIALPVLLALVVAGCSLEAPSDPSALNNPPSVEDAGARYVAVGNSLTAGFMDGGLIMSGQSRSFPKLIAGQLGLTSAQFTQPWIASPGIGSSTPSDPANVAGVLYFNGASIAILDETPRTAIQSTLLLAATQPTQYHNLGVPGATLHDGMNAYSAATSAGAGVGSPNPFFDFINRATLFGNKAVDAGYPGPSGFVPVTFQSASQFYQAVAKGGALTTLWLGNNDVLGPATSGSPPAGFGPASAAAFQADYTALLSMLAGGLAARNNGLKPTIVVANIPDVSSTPYFIPAATFDAYVRSQLGGVSWPGGYAESNPTFFRFPALSWIATNAATQNFVPVPANYTLSATEAVDVATAVGTYNQIIAGVAAAVNASGIAKVGVVDANLLMAGRSVAEKTHFLFLLSPTVSVAQAAATTLFSLDGLHPNPRGYGVLANAFIAKINELDNTSIAPVDLASAALTWDPTYGQPLPTKAAGDDSVLLTPEAAAAMDAIFR